MRTKTIILLNAYPLRILEYANFIVLQLRKQQLQQEQEKVRILQASLKVLAQEHLDLERSIGGGPRSPSIMADSDNDEFYECEDTRSESMDVLFTSISNKQRS